MRDFYLPVEVGAVRGLLRARDVPVWAFFADYPGEQATDEARQAWKDALLARVVVDPVLTDPVIQGLRAARHEPVAAFFAAVGWYRGLEHVFGRPRFVPPDAPELFLPADPWLEAQTPHKEIVDWLLALGEGYGVVPSALWRTPISEALWLSRLREGSGARALPPEVSIVGMEEPGA